MDPRIDLGVKVGGENALVEAGDAIAPIQTHFRSSAMGTLVPYLPAL